MNGTDPIPKIFWLASYPKSGNTWFRLLVTKLYSGQDADIDINAQAPLLRGAIASDRRVFEAITLLDSTELTFEEIDALRPRVDYALQSDPDFQSYDCPTENVCPPVIFRKVHDACHSGVGGAAGVILLVRDPRDVAISLACHNGTSVDEAITLMENPQAELSGTLKTSARQLRQRLLSWSMHCESWLSQTNMPVHVLRYEDLLADTAGRFRAAMAACGVSVSEEKARMAAQATAFNRLREKERVSGFRENPGHSRYFFRSGQAGGWRTVLNAAQVARIVHAHGRMMRQLGYIRTDKE